MLRFLCATAFVLFSSASSFAGYIKSVAYDSSKSVGITVRFTTSSGAVSGNTSMNAGVFNVTYSDTLAGSGTSFQAFCVDLLHGMSSATNLKADAIDLGSTTNSGNFYGYSNFADVGNRLSFLVSNITTTTNFEYAALQAALWKTVDRNFTISGSSANDVQVRNLMNSYLSQLSSSYNAATDYAGTYLKIDRTVNGQTNYYQNLATKWNGGNPPGVLATPAPSSAVLAVVGIGVIGIFRLSRRKQSKA